MSRGGETRAAPRCGRRPAAVMHFTDGRRVNKGYFTFTITMDGVSPYSACSFGWWLMAGAGLF
jgi:hypothetical protein